MNDYDRIAKAIEYITEHVNDQPTLEDIANHINLSPYHFQRLFSRWAGISPKRFLQVLTVDHAKRLIGKPGSLLDITHELGLSSSARLHDHFITLEAVTPGQYKNQGEGLEIIHGHHETPFGWAFVAATERGICHLAFVDNQQLSAELTRLKKSWPAAMIKSSPEQSEALIGDLFSAGSSPDKPLSLFVSGTNFQISVWRALLRIPWGTASTYGQVASMIGRPTASRAVGQAVGANPIAYLIPCHRVLQSSGAVGNYRWGQTRKQAMLAWESAHELPPQSKTVEGGLKPFRAR